tara:strand:+ start:1232 stop:1801 length:570 start_codon:yes stop_codon:yes gene_type:complete
MTLIKFFDSLLGLAAISIIILFFQPWVSGEGSLFNPVEKITDPIGKIEPTGIFKGVIKLTKGSLDKVTGVITGKKLKEDLSGYQIAVDKSKEIGPKAYLVLLIPFLGLLCFIISLLTKKNIACTGLVLVITLSLFIFLKYQISNLARHDLFLEVRVNQPLIYTVYAFLVMSSLSFFKLIASLKFSKTKN